MTGPVRKSSVEHSDLPDGLALFDPERSVAHHLNAVATLIWELCDGRSEESIVSAVAGILEIDRAAAQSHVDSCLASLRAQRLLD